MACIAACARPELSAERQVACCAWLRQRKWLVQEQLTLHAPNVSRTGNCVCVSSSACNVIFCKQCSRCAHSSNIQHETLDCVCTLTKCACVWPSGNSSGISTAAHHWLARWWCICPGGCCHLQSRQRHSQKRHMMEPHYVSATM